MAGQFWDLICFSSHSLRVRFNTSERVHIRLAICTVLTIELIFAKGLRWGIYVSLGRFCIEGTTVDLFLEGFEMLYLSPFSGRWGKWPFKVWVCLLNGLEQVGQDRR